MIKLDRAGLFDAQAVKGYNETFLAFHNGTSWITQPTYAYYGDGLVCGVKLVWDIMRGFSLNASARFDQIYLDEQKMRALQPICLASLLSLCVWRSCLKPGVRHQGRNIPTIRKLL